MRTDLDKKVWRPVEFTSKLNCRNEYLLSSVLIHTTVAPVVASVVLTFTQHVSSTVHSRVHVGAVGVSRILQLPRVRRVVAPPSLMLGTFLLVVAAACVASTPFVGPNVLQASPQLFLGGASPPPHSLCMNTGVDASDIYCDSPGSELHMASP